MPISTPHPEYEAMAPEWQRCRDAYRGRQAVRAATTRYLPWNAPAVGLEDHTAYADRAVWCGATERTVLGLAGALSRKDTGIDVPARPAPHLDDEYAAQLRTRYRELSLEPVGGRRALRERLWVEVTSPGEGTRREVAATYRPTRRNDALPWIPVVPVGAQAVSWQVERPALMDLVDLNLAHWRSSADYEAALACIKPVYYLFGVPTGTQIVLNSRRAITSEDTSASAGILQGADPAGLRTAIGEKRHAMATLGARLLEAQPDVGETATAVRMRHAGDEASLRTIAPTMGEALTRPLRYHAWWTGADDGPIEVRPNMDYVPARLSPDELRAYMELLNNGRISYETFYALLQAGEIARPEVAAEEELAAIEKETESELGQLQTLLPAAAAQTQAVEGQGQPEPVAAES